MGCLQSSDAQGEGSGGKSLLMLGLDGSGSTTILYQIVTGKKLETIPTLSFNHEEIKYNGVEYQIYDIGGLDKLRPLWKQYSKEANGYVFVLDAADRGRATVASQELQKFYSGEGTKKGAANPDNPLLVYANKQDLPDAMNAEEVEKLLDLASLPVSAFKVFPCCGKTGENLRAGLDWLTEVIKQ
mmetsp:Transcript_52987/g.129948  ORF Transcript_52987/g.129948 Transcript_52987/m.129948 type:complete len:185 (+) Transcript_52987:87-641(+)